ncbi:hypothetical protein DDE82_008938 [Stemphylium lycopersici]|nr:hypothetical protein TW65_99353 [Stemphylium lycopersici]RAQ98754.1 hypothetical protein DDE82_008938 [Stemphylium lycopersici]
MAQTPPSSSMTPASPKRPPGCFKALGYLWNWVRGPADLEFACRGSSAPTDESTGNNPWDRQNSLGNTISDLSTQNLKPGANDFVDELKYENYTGSQTSAQSFRKGSIDSTSNASTQSTNTKYDNADDNAKGHPPDLFSESFEARKEFIRNFTAEFWDINEALIKPPEDVNK